MRLLLVNAQGADLAAGGSGRYVADLARGLTARGHDVHVLAASPVREDGADSTTVLHRTHWRESRVRRFGNHAGDLVSRPGRRLEWAVAASRPELVHTSNLPGFSTAIWEVARRQELPVVHTLHDYHLLCPRASHTRRDGSPCCPHPTFCSLRTRRLVRWAGAVSDVITGSDHLWAREGQLFPGASAHVVRVPIVPVADRPLEPPRTPPRTISYLGGLDVIKGVRELLDAATALSELGLRLHIAGDGRLKPNVEAAARTGVVYEGPVLGSAKIAFMESTDVAVVPSTWEEPNGPPYVVAEWIAAGRPVLSSVRGGLAEAQALPGVLPLEPTVPGIVIAARKLLENETWPATLAALKPVNDTADMERWLDAHEAVYESALSARRRSRTSA
jgi:glycosyltransferase involved in cell wall biosynthesis